MKGDNLLRGGREGPAGRRGRGEGQEGGVGGVDGVGVAYAIVGFAVGGQGGGCVGEGGVTV